MTTAIRDTGAQAYPDTTNGTAINADQLTPHGSPQLIARPMAVPWSAQPYGDGSRAVEPWSRSERPGRVRSRTRTRVRGTRQSQVSPVGEPTMVYRCCHR